MLGVRRKLLITTVVQQAQEKTLPPEVEELQAMMYEEGVTVDATDGNQLHSLIYEEAEVAEVTAKDLNPELESVSAENQDQTSRSSTSAGTFDPLEVIHEEDEDDEDDISNESDGSPVSTQRTRSSAQAVTIETSEAKENQNSNDPYYYIRVLRQVRL